MTLRRIDVADASFGAMVAALADSDLATTDLHDDGPHYFAMGADKAFCGIVLFGPIAFLRSFVVVKHSRGKGLGNTLMTGVLDILRTRAVRDVWLITMDAAPFFAKHGFEHVKRISVPAAIAATKQFRELCPVSATLMHLNLL